MRPVVIALLLGMALGFTTPVTAAQVVLDELPDCASSQGGRSVECLAGQVRRTTANVIKTAEATLSAASSITYVPYDQLVLTGDPSTVACTDTRYKAAEPASGPLEPGPLAGQTVARFTQTAFPDCPIAPSEPTSDGASEAEETFVSRYWDDVLLPTPQPYIAPGRAITGMYAYLETRGTTSHTYTEPDTPFGPLTVVATGRYYVDWGDGTTTGPHSAEGGPWPDGTIKHEYIHIGNYDVVVTERWTATWSFGDRSGTLDELRTVGRIEDFPVQQIQAVVLR